MMSVMLAFTAASVNCLPFASLMASKRIDAMNRESPNTKSPIPSVLLSPSSSSPSSSSTSSAAAAFPAITPCDFETYDPSGCEDEEGSYCESSSQKCLCRDGFSIRLLAYCLTHKQIGQDCFTSAQCASIPNAACFIFGKEYDNERISGGHNVGRQVSNWPTGTCRCSMGYQWNNETSSCIKKLVGSWCNDDWDCIKEKFNTQCSRPKNICECSWGYFYDSRTDSCQVPKLYGLKCLSNSECAAENLICSPTTSRCVCPAGFHFDVIHPGCKPNDDSSCDKGYKWDEEWGRCIPARSPAAAFPFNQLNQNRNSASSNSNSNNNNNIAVNNRNPGDPASGVNNMDDSASSSSFSTALILILPNVVAFALIMHYCYFRQREEDVSDLDGGALRSTHVHNLAKFCAYPPYGRSGLIKGPACTGPVFPGVPCCAVAGKLHVGPKLSILESVAEEGRLDSGSEAGAESTTDQEDKTKEKGSEASEADAKTSANDADGDDDSTTNPPPPSCSELNEISSGNGKQLDSKSATEVTITENPCVSSECIPRKVLACSSSPPSSPVDPERKTTTTSVVMATGSSQETRGVEEDDDAATEREHLP